MQLRTPDSSRRNFRKTVVVEPQEKQSTEAEVKSEPQEQSTEAEVKSESQEEQPSEDEKK